MSVFVIATAFVFAFAPGMIQPFTGGLEEETVATNRLADTLADGMLGDPAEPGVLNRTCTTEFFAEGRDGNTSNSVPPDCRFEDDVSLNARVGAEGRPAGTGFRLSIEITGDADGNGTQGTLCDTGSELTDFDPETESCSGTAYRIGGPPSNSVGTVVTKRVVYLPVGTGIDARLRVVVW
ncbi:DUF7287 family protein [Halomarina litorea]|uniref:DUF7287 family protein n=1 Tax=Halomarina litorea TaxID=2961595 RepID=UPI0020C3DB93|nr:hypothetical protein [Halomarina sp. BCD28]